MVDWRSPEVSALCVFLFRQMTVFVLGAYLWYFVLTLKDVEAGLIRRRIRFTPAHIPYLTARYCNLVELLTIVISSHLRRPLLGCEGTVPTKITAVTGNIALAAASSNLGVRAVILWRHIPWFSHLLIAICMVHVLFGGTLGVLGVKTTWDPAHKVCLMMTDRAQKGLLGFYGFTLVWDVVILILTIMGLRQQDMHRSPLSSALFTQGVGYVVVACVTCIPMAVIAYLDLNNTMNIFPAIPGCTIIVMMSSAVVISLLKLNDSDGSSDGFSNGPPGRGNNTKSDSLSHGALTTHISLAPTGYRDSGEIQDERFDVDPSRQVNSSIAKDG